MSSDRPEPNPRSRARPRPARASGVRAAGGDRRQRWGRSFSTSGAVHLGLILASFSIPVVALRGDRARKLPSVAVVAQPERLVRVEWSEPTEPERELQTVEALLPEPELREEPLPELPEEPREPEPAHDYPVEASFVTRAVSPPPFPPMERQRPEDAKQVPEPQREPAPGETDPPEVLAQENAEPAEPERPGVDTDETAPELLLDLSPRPPYPVLAQRMQWEGAVICRISVGVEGRVVGVTLERSSGHDVLDRAALEGVRRWRFRPGTRGGEPARMDVRKRVLFQLQG